MNDLLKRITQPSGFAGIATSALGGSIVEGAVLFSTEWWLALVTVVAGIVAAFRDERKVK